MRVVKILLLSIILFTSGCSGAKGVGGYKPPILPLRVSVDTNGNISFELETEIEYPTPLGTFSVGVVVEPAKYFNIGSTLTIRIDCQENFYDLHGRDFSIKLESGYYEKLNLAKRGDDILLDLRRIDAGSIVCPTPVIEEYASSSTNIDPYYLSLTQESIKKTQIEESYMESVYVDKVQVLTIRQVLGDDCESSGSCDRLVIMFTVHNSGSLSAELQSVWCISADNLQWQNTPDFTVEPGKSLELACPIRDNTPDTYSINVAMGREVGNYTHWNLIPYTGIVSK